MIGRVIKIFSDFYYVETELGVVEAKLKSILKKQKEDILTGDYVELEQLDTNSMQGFISCRKDRTNFLSKPKVANISQVIIVSSLKEPDLNFEQLDRYIAHCEYHKVQPILCFNKEDIDEFDDLRAEIIDMYMPIGYQVIFTSALEKTGIEELKPFLNGNTSILCGQSGVGKSSIINAILNSSKQKTLPVSEKTKRGIHTTRHCELISLNQNSFLVDTPGFSHLKFDFLLPNEIENLFVEFKIHELNCKFKDCLHLGEFGCGAKDVIENMAQSRYESYKKFILEANEYKEEISKKSIKIENNVKFNQNRIMTKISSKKRNLSRKTNNQKIYREEL